MIAYLDSSVLLRIVLGQRDRLEDWRRVREGVASALVEVECLRTLDRLKLSAGLSDRDLAARREAVYRLLDEVSVIDAGSTILSRASQPFPTPLGTPDAIHLATALAWRESGHPDLVMATHDAALGTAARAMGFDVRGVA
jgi:predicted nucleic acid-binding protein